MFRILVILWIRLSKYCLGALGFGLCSGLLFGVGRLLCFGIVVKRRGQYRV